jgi:hypothetical protein
VAELRWYRCAAAGFWIPVPAAWETSEEVAGAALVTVEPERDGAFRGNVVVTAETVAPELDLRAWAERCVELLCRELNRCHLLDAEDTEVGGVPARRALVHYVQPAFGGVNLEQWMLKAGVRGLVISASTAVPDYDDRRDLMAAIASGLRLEGT